MPIHEIRHPLVRHKIGLMREGDISTKKFRELTAELARLLAYEACKDFPLEAVSIMGPTPKAVANVMSVRKMGIIAGSPLAGNSPSNRRT